MNTNGSITENSTMITIIIAARVVQKPFWRIINGHGTASIVTKDFTSRFAPFVNGLWKPLTGLIKLEGV